MWYYAISCVMLASVNDGVLICISTDRWLIKKAKTIS